MRSIDLDRGRLEEWDVPMSKTHWMRHKKASVDLLNDSPFAIDRQLEDQRYLMKQNKVSSARMTRFFNTVIIYRTRAPTN